MLEIEKKLIDVIATQNIYMITQIKAIKNLCKSRTLPDEVLAELEENMIQLRMIRKCTFQQIEILLNLED